MSLTEGFTVTAILEAINISSQRSAPHPIVNRPCCGLSFCTDGEIRYTHQGRVFVSRPGVAILHPMDSTYILERTVDGHFPLINFLCEGDFPADAFTAIPLQEPERYLRRFEKLQQYCQEPRNRYRAMAVLYEMLAMLEEEQRPDSQPLQRAIVYLQEHYSDPLLRIEDVAAHAGISQVWLRRQFAAAYGISPKQYVLERRLSKAQRLLAENRYGISQIAEDCGFTSIYHFSRCFKEKTGYTPSAYAARQRQLPL